MAINQNMLAGLIQLIITLIPLFRKAGAADLAADLEAITARADQNYHDVIALADERLGDG